MAIEKEVLGIYLSGHPLERYQQHYGKNDHCKNHLISSLVMRKKEERQEEESRVKDNQKVIVGGMITEKNIKYTKE